MKTTLRSISNFSQFAINHIAEPLSKLLHHFGKSEADDTEVRIIDIIDILGVRGALLTLIAVDGYEREKRLLAVAYAKNALNMITVQSNDNVLEVAERFANGMATQSELNYAFSKSQMLTMAANSPSASAVHQVETIVYWSFVPTAIELRYLEEGRRGILLHFHEEELRRVCLAIEAGQDPYPYDKE